MSDTLCPAAIKMGLESPIEEALLAEVVIRSEARGYAVRLGEGPEPAIEFYPQFAVDCYRIDFLVRLPGRSRSAVVCVECDGHEYHERTKEQAERDRQKDRFLQSTGATVFRFTGSEIWRDARGCAEEILNELSRQLARGPGCHG